MKYFRSRLIIFSLIISISGYGPICGALAASNTPSPNNSDSTVHKSEMTTVNPQIGSSQPASLNLQQLPSLIEIPQTPESIEKVLKLEDEGEKLFQQRLLDKALVKWQEAYGMSLEMKYSEGEGRSLTNMGRVFLERGQFIKAKYMGENAIEILTGVSDKKALGRAHLYLAEAYYGLDNPAWAGEQLDFAMKAFTAAGGNNANETAKVMSLAASILVKVGKLKEALQFLQAAATYYGQAGDNIGAVSTRAQVVHILLALGLLTAAQEEAEKAVSTARTAPDQIANLTSALACLANCKVALGEYLEAKTIYEQLLAYSLKIPGEQMNSLSRANIYLGYGTTMSALGEYEQAKKAFDFALPVFKSAGASLSQAQTANNLSIVELGLNHPTQARELLEQALDLHNLIEPKQDAFRVTVLQNIACVESRLGQDRDARAHLETAANYLKKVKEDTWLGRTDLALAETAFKLAEQSEAERVLDEAIKLSQSVSDDSSLWREYTLLGKLQIGQNNLKAAHESLQSAVSFFRSPQAGVFPSPEKCIYISRRQDAAYQLIRLLVQEKMIDQALLACEQLKQESFLENWTTRGAKLRGEDAELYTDLATQRAHLHAAEVSSPPSKITKDWQEWIVRFRTLCSQNKSLARMIAPMPISPTDLTRVAQASRGTIFEYLLGKESSIVFTLNKTGKLNAITLNINTKLITTQINSLLSSFGQDNPSSDNAASIKLLHSLYGELFPDTIKEWLPADAQETLVIIPDGALANLPFAALLNGQNKFLIANHTITLCTTLDSLLECPPRYADNSGFLFVGSEDLKAIGKSLPSSAVTYLSGAQTSLNDLQDQVRAKTAVHLEGNCEFGTNILDSVLPLYANKKGGSSENANLLNVFASSLPCDLIVLNGATVKKANNLESNTMSPVLMAAHAFQYAGTRNVLISLWRKALSEQTGLWQDFYNNLDSGDGFAVALRKAELSSASHNPYPGNWAMLQLFGPGY